MRKDYNLFNSQLGILGAEKETVTKYLLKEKTIPLLWISDEKSLKDFWGDCEESRREERIMAEIYTKCFGNILWQIGCWSVDLNS